MNSLAEILATYWIKLYKLKPLLTGLLTAATGLAISIGVAYLDYTDRQKREEAREMNLDYKSQVEQLNKMEGTVKELLNFVSQQKRTLQETEDTISSLRAEKEKLEPLVETDRATVEALFRAQEERATARVWRERWIGFAFGVGASLVASFIWFVFRLLWVNKSMERGAPSARAD